MRSHLSAFILVLYFVYMYSKARGGPKKLDLIFQRLFLCYLGRILLHSWARGGPEQ